MDTNAHVVAAACNPKHRFSKPVANAIELIAGRGVKGDAHCGESVRHRSRVAANPDRPNLRQVHLIHSELLTALQEQDFPVQPGELGENITTAGVDLLSLPRGTRLRLGESAAIEVTGLRNPCWQIDAFMPGLLAAVLSRAPDGSLVRKCGIMAIVERSGFVRPGDAIRVEIPPAPHRALDVV